MSLIQQVATTLLLFKADTSDVKAKIKELTGLEKEAAKAQLKSIEDRNSGYERLAKGITKANVALAAVQKVFEVGAAGFKAYEERLRLSTAGARYNLDQLRSASQGLKTDTELLNLAAASANTTYALTQEQLNTAVRAMRSFEKQGNDIAKVQQAMGEAITKGSIEPLKQFGVNLELAKTPAERYSQLMSVLSDNANLAGVSQSTATDEVRRAGVEWQNTIEKLKIEVGKFVVSFGPLLKGLADIASGLADIANAVPDWMKEPWWNKIPADLLYTAANNANQPYRDALRARMVSTVQDATGVSAANEAIARATALSHEKRKGGARKPRESNAPEYYVETRDGLMPVFADALGGAGFGSSIAGLSDRARGAAQFAETQDILRQVQGMGTFVRNLELERQQSVMEGIFGPLAEFDAYQKAFAALTSAVSSAYTAWVTGSESVGSAIKKAIGASLLAAGSEMAVEALKHAAYAVGSLAFGDARGAALHGKSAALFTVGAVAAGLAASKLGAGGASAGPSAPQVTGGTSIAGYLGGGSQPYQGAHVTNYIGDYFGSNPRQRDRQVARAMRSASRELGGSQGVTFR